MKSVSNEHIRTTAPDAANNTRTQAKSVPVAQASQLHQGEIVRGLILEVANNKGLVKVQLPAATVNAIVESKSLRSGDTVLFRVQQSKPSLILRVHSVPVSTGGKTVASDDIIRMLGFDVTPGRLAITDSLREKVGYIEADALRELAQAVGNLRGIDVDRESLKNVVATFVRMQELGAPLTTEFFRLMHAPLRENVDLARSFRGVEKYAHEVPDTLRSIIQAIREALTTKASDFKEFLKRFAIQSPGDEAQHNIYALLRRFVATAEAETLQSEATGSAMRAASEMMERLEGRQLLNLYTHSFNGESVYSIVLPLRDTLVSARLRVKRSNKPDASGNNVYSFRLHADLTELGEVAISGQNIGRSLALALQLESESDVELVEQRKSELIDALRDVGVALRTLSISAAPGAIPIEGTDDDGQDRQTGINVVV